ncbi:MAG: zinc ribbon domain-containing protein [Acidobacteriota bacterium]|nr:zinc ribbon domain-containing protein [Acidobacteriota bacterium]
MFCPQCGQRQAANEVRFCSSCGFPLGGVSEVLANAGQLPARTPAAAAGTRQLTPRQKGIRQGAMLMLSTMLVVPLVSFISVFVTGAPELFVPAAAVICFVGGLLRIFYALLLEGAVTHEMPTPAVSHAQAYVPPPMPPNYLGTPERGAALPPPQSQPVPAYRPARRDTGEIATPPTSVTDHTTRLLERQPEEPPQQ